jgi:hypothetical protein
MSLTDYSSIEQSIANAPEPSCLEAGSEVKARIITVRSGISDKNECKWYSVVFDVPDEPMAMEFNDFFWELDQTKLTAKDYQRSLYKFKNFSAAFEIDYSRPFSWEDDLVGKEGWVILGIKKSEQYGDQNTIKKFIVPSF